MTALDRSRQKTPSPQQFHNLQWCHIDPRDLTYVPKRSGEDLVRAVIAAAANVIVDALVTWKAGAEFARRGTVHVKHPVTFFERQHGFANPQIDGSQI